MDRRHPFGENKQCQLCEDYYDSIVTTKLYTQKELVMMETSIVDCHQHFYITTIQKLELHLTHIHIIGTHTCGNTHLEAFRLRAD